MVRHQPFFDMLALAQTDSQAWAATVAGLAVLRLVDAAREDSSVIDSDWMGLRAVVQSVAALREGTPYRRSLMKLVDQLSDKSSSWLAIDATLNLYGRALYVDGNWSLAADVFATVADIAREERDPELAVDATTALGAAARRSGDWDKSAESYREAAYLAEALGDKASGLTIRVETANTQIARGNLPAAQAILDDVISEARKSGLDGVEAVAYHSSASVAHLSGRFADAVTLAYKALEKTTNPAVKDTVMGDIAAAFIELGMLDAGRDAHLIISMSSRYQWVRWQAGINLMELAAMDGLESAFDSHAGDLRNAALDPRLRSYFLLYYGKGCLVFGRDDEGRKSLEEAREFAGRNKINQVAFDAEKALADAAERGVRTGWSLPAEVEPVPPEVAQVADALSHLREEALSSHPAKGPVYLPR
jgi:tetratricopeptide (TPR) repeat protein